MAKDLEIPFDRITYRHGQLLTARDLRDDTRRDARLRWLHVSHLHETWGIALGLTVQPATADGKAVVVGPGYAVDAAGRDILLSEGIRLPVPNAIGPEAFVLVLGYQEDAAFLARPDLAALCLAGGLDPRNERPSFSWQRPEHVRFGPQVPLVQVVVANGVASGGLDFRVRRNARPLVRPHIAAGATESGRTGWRPWEGARGLTPGIEIVVDTSDAGFASTPYYFAVLHADLWLRGTKAVFALDAFSFITKATPASFAYRLIRADGLPFGTAVSATDAEARKWTVSWLGVEPVAGCEPALDLARIFLLSGFNLAALQLAIGGG